jgi:hypothetical protein
MTRFSGSSIYPACLGLATKHYGVKLPDEDFHRFTLWLDCNSEYYGSYEQTAAQARGEIVRPRLD